MPTISVIIPTYNNEKTILSTIKSIQAQTFSDLEMIVINDGSTDKTLEVLGTITDERLKIFTYENSGVSVARNRGISLAKGSYISFMDADDLWTKDKLQLQLSALLQHGKAGLAYSLTYIMSENGNKIHKCDPILIEGNVYSELLNSNFIIGIASNILVRKSAIDDIGYFDSSLSHYEDWDWCLRLARKWSFIAIPQYQIFYRQSLRSASSNISAFEKSALTVIERGIQNASKEMRLVKSKSIANCRVHWAELYLTRIADSEGIKQARSHLFQAIHLYPKILINKKVQILLLKLIIMHLLTPTLAVKILTNISEKRAIKVQDTSFVKSHY